MVHDRARVVNQLQKVLESVNLRLSFLEEQIASFDAQIIAYIEVQTRPPTPPSTADDLVARMPPVASSERADVVPWDEAVALVDTVPGVGQTLAEIVIAEVGTDMRRFPSAAHLASWARVSPGNHESAGKRYSSKTGKGSRWLRTALIQAAWGAVKVKDAHVAAVYRRLAMRRGKQKAIMAVAHRLLVAIYHMLKDRVPYRERGTAPPTEHAKRKAATRMQRQIEHLGYTVTLRPATTVVR